MRESAAEPGGMAPSSDQVFQHLGGCRLLKRCRFQPTAFFVDVTIITHICRNFKGVRQNFCKILFQYDILPENHPFHRAFDGLTSIWVNVE
jgi:hypothetical protein